MIILSFLVVVLSSVATLLMVRLNLMSWLIHIVAPEKTQLEIQTHLNTEAAQKNTIEAQAARLSLVEQSLQEVLKAREQDAAVIAILRRSRVGDHARLIKLEQDHETDAETITHLTAERDSFKEQVDAQAVTIVNLTVRVLELERRIAESQGEVHE